MIILCDIDGTIADCSHRLHFIKPSACADIGQGDFVADWDAFFKACVDDKPIHEVIEVIRALHARGGHLITYFSGRSDEVRAETKAWLMRHGLPSGDLYMRTQGDHRPDHIVKSELFDRFLLDRDIEDCNLGGIVAFDDRDQVVKMWRARGVRCFQVAEGKF